MSKINKFIVLMSVFIFLLVIPSTFAIDNDSLIQTNDTATVEVQTAIQDDSILEAANSLYFDASVERDGDGSIKNPYKYLTSYRINKNSNIHLANGEYDLDNTVSVNGVTITGEDSEKTIINYYGNAFDVKGTFTLNSLTLNGINILNKGKIIAKNTIFANGTGYTADEYGNNFGGAIYTPADDYGSRYSVDLTNCSFINNTAEYGGAIYMEKGYLTVKDSLFMDNVAYNYGGAIAAEFNQRTVITNTKFKNDKSTNDAGGAIYLRESAMTGEGLTFTNCSATFGGGITSLNSAMTLKSINAENNTAKYGGGVIFHMYESFSLTSSSFNNNSAHNGGALFIDNSTSLTLMTTTFTNNRAEYSAGAVYSLLNHLTKGNSLKDSINKNIFENNTAFFKDDEYEESKIDIRIGSGNYTMFKVNETNISTLPSYYSLINYEQVSPVKNQEDGGNCWAFASIAALESCILKASGNCYDLSEENMKNLIEIYSDYGRPYDTNDGGIDEMAIGYLVSWLGPVNETDDITDDKSTLSPVLNSIMHIQNVIYLERKSYTDNDAIKEALMKYGAVATGIYMYDDTPYMRGSNYYYYGSESEANHEVTIVGWDDNYSKNKFYNSPKGNGAWIVKNSWDTDWADNGYFYVSYYDKAFAKVGQSDASYTFILNDTIRLDKNYQYDIAGKTDYFMNSSSEVWYKNMFTATDNEMLAAVSTYFEKITQWDVSVYVNNVLKTTKSGISNPGYYTINLDELVPMVLGDIFEVVFHISVDDEAGFPISEKISLNKEIYDKGLSFVSYNGRTWQDLYDLSWDYSSHTYSSQVACIKAFTVLKEIETFTSINITYDKFNPVNITATVIDEYGKYVTSGSVTFTINGKDNVVDVVNGIATLIHEFDKKENDVLVTFNGIGYKSSTNATSVNISLMNVDLNLNISKNLNSAVINVSASKKINTIVSLLINTEQYNITLVNGKGLLRLEELNNGNYNVTAKIENTEIFNSTAKEGSFSIYVIATKINSNDFITDEYGSEKYTITLTGNETALANMKIRFILNGATYNETTDENGTAAIPINLAGGSYNITIIFDGQGDYLKSEANNTIKVRHKVNVNLDVIQEINNVVINVETSKPINESIKISVNGDAHIVDVVNGQGNLTLNDLENNNYTLVGYLVNDIDYISNQTIASFKINVGNLSIIANDFNTTNRSGELYKIKLSDENNAGIWGKTLFFNLNGKTYNSTTDENGIASIPITLDSGNYEVTVYFNGDNDFFAANTKNNISVKDQIEISITQSQTIKDVAITFKLSKSIDESLDIVINGMNYTIEASKGKATLNLKDLENGEYNVTAKLSSEERYVSKLSTTSFIINITDATIKSSDMNLTDYSNQLYTIQLVDINNQPISNKKIRFSLNDVIYTRTTDRNGIASIRINLASGEYDLFVYFNGGNDYYPTSTMNRINVEQSIIAQITLYKSKDSVTFDIEISNPINDIVNVTVNGNTHKVSIINGKGSLTLEDTSDYYDVKVSSDKLVINSNVVMEKIMDINCEDFTTYWQSGSEYKVTLLANNEPESGKTITFTLNGVIYSKTTDSNGIAYINVNLNVGTYDITIIHGDVIKSQKISVIKTISGNKDLTKYYKGREVYKVRVWGDNGKAVGAGELVVMNINGKNHKVHTDKNGYASFKVNLKPKKYTITATYKGFKVTNKITIKSTVITKNISKKKAKTVKFTAKLVNSKGKVLKSKKVTFKINGKTYKVKTNSKGIASLKLKNLKVGKHTIYSSYGGLKVKNTIKIKK